MTNKWQLDEQGQDSIVITRVADDIPILKMLVSVEQGDGLLSSEGAKDIAQQIIDDWNFSCEDLER